MLFKFGILVVVSLIWIEEVERVRTCVPIIFSTTVPATSTSTTPATPTPTCTFDNRNYALIPVQNLTCSNAQCSLEEGAMGIGLIACHSNEVNIGGECLTLSDTRVFLRCSNEQLEVKVQTHMFGELDRWNPANFTTLSGVTSITCQDCDDNCVFGFANERSFYVATPPSPVTPTILTEDLVLPSNALCSINPNFYDIDEGGLAFTCKLQSGLRTLITSCTDDIEVQTTEMAVDRLLGVNSATFECINGVLSPVGGTLGGVPITGNVLSINCDND